MKKLRNLILAFMLMFGTAAIAGEDVTVTWTPPVDVATFPYDGYTIFYTDSTGTNYEIPINDKNIVTHTVTNVEFGPSSWVMTSKCSVCVVKESVQSNTVAFIVEFKGTPSAPILNEVVLYTSPSASLIKFEAKVAGNEYSGKCNIKRRNLKCAGKEI